MPIFDRFVAEDETLPHGSGPFYLFYNVEAASLCDATANNNDVGKGRFLYFWQADDREVADRLLSLLHRKYPLAKGTEGCRGVVGMVDAQRCHADDRFLIEEAIAAGPKGNPDMSSPEHAVGEFILDCLNWIAAFTETRRRVASANEPCSQRGPSDTSCRDDEEDFDVDVAAAHAILKDPLHFRDAIEWWNTHIHIHCRKDAARCARKWRFYECDNDTVRTNLWESLSWDVTINDILTTDLCSDLTIDGGNSMTAEVARRLLVVAAMGRRPDIDWASIGLKVVPVHERVSNDTYSPAHFERQLLRKAWRLLYPQSLAMHATFLSPSDAIAMLKLGDRTERARRHIFAKLLKHIPADRRHKRGKTTVVEVNTWLELCDTLKTNSKTKTDWADAVDTFEEIEERKAAARMQKRESKALESFRTRSA